MGKKNWEGGETLTKIGEKFEGGNSFLVKMGEMKYRASQGKQSGNPQKHDSSQPSSEKKVMKGKRGSGGEPDATIPPGKQTGELGKKNIGRRSSRI